MTNVLIVEDNQLLLESIAFELEMREFDVMQAENGVEAMAVLRQADSMPDIIVSDIAMPEMDGYALLENVRAEHEWQQIPFIFLTAFDSKNAMRIGKDLGVDDYLAKPFDPEELVLAMNNKLKRFEQLKQHAARAVDDMRQELLDMISHTLRTPLTSIYGSGEMLAKTINDVPDELTGRLLSLLRSSTNRMKLLIERIVALAQISSGKMTAQFEREAAPVNLNEVVMAALKQYIQVEGGPEVTAEFTDDAVIVNGLSSFLTLVVGELLDNAVRFSDGDGEVRLRVYKQSGEGVIDVEDTGMGIDDEHLEKIREALEIFGGVVGRKDDIGMGLSLVRDTVHIHGGACEISSIHGDGTIFMCRMPLA